MSEYQKRRLFPKREKFLIRDFMESVRKVRPDAWFFKTHGEPMQVRGVPDVIMCVGGLFVAIEFKIRRNGKITYSPLQEYTIGLINQARGYAVTVWHDESDGTIGIGEARFKGRKEAIEHFFHLINPIIDGIGKIQNSIKKFIEMEDS